MPDLTPSQREFIVSRWRNQWESILQAQNQVVNWIFAVHGGGIAGLLAYAASKGSSRSVFIGLISFAVGLVLIVIYATVMFYFEAGFFTKFRRNVEQLFSDAIEWKEFSRREAERPDRYLTCVVLAWVSGVCGFIGIVAAVIAIL